MLRSLLKRVKGNSSGPLNVPPGKKYLFSGRFRPKRLQPGRIGQIGRRRQWIRAAGMAVFATDAGLQIGEVHTALADGVGGVAGEATVDVFERHFATGGFEKILGSAGRGTGRCAKGKVQRAGFFEEA